MSGVLLGTPTTRDLPVAYTHSLFTTGLKDNLGWYAVQGQDIATGRNRVTKVFLESYPEFDYLLMHDSDATWHPNSVQRLLDHKLPVVTGIIFHRHLPTLPTVGIKAGVEPEGKTMYDFTPAINRIAELFKDHTFSEESKNEILLPPKPEHLVEIDGCGMHFCLIRRDVLEKIGYPWFQCITPNAGEDFYFCRKVQEAGFKIYADFGVYTGHVAGPGIEIGVRELMMYMRDNEKMKTVWYV